MTWFKPQSVFQTDLFIDIFLLDWGPIWTSQYVFRKWIRRDFLCVSSRKIKTSHWAFLDGILSRSWSFRIRTWTRNAKLTRLVIFIFFKIWNRHAPRNTTRNVTSFWISRYTWKITSGSYQGDFLTRIDWALWKR